MSEPIRWGIMGTGNIARQFARGLKHVSGAVLTAVGSRTLERADEFAREFDVPHGLGSYELLAKSGKVDVIYIATPHSEHHANALLAVQHGKHVLVEKPFTLNAAQAREVFDAARERGLFCMEAFWTRFLPAYRTARGWLEQGMIGELQFVTADFGIRTTYKPGARLWEPSLGGGALLDVGIYPVGVAMHAFGRKPVDFFSRVERAETGVDTHAAITLDFGGGAVAMLYTSLVVASSHLAVLTGTEGTIHLGAPFFCGTKATLRRRDGTVLEANCPLKGNGYEYEAAHVGECLRAGRTESDLLPAADTLAVMETLDAIRASWGLRYPGEDGA